MDMVDMFAASTNDLDLSELSMEKHSIPEWSVSGLLPTGASVRSESAAFLAKQQSTDDDRKAWRRNRMCNSSAFSQSDSRLDSCFKSYTCAEPEPASSSKDDTYLDESKEEEACQTHSEELAVDDSHQVSLKATIGYDILQFEAAKWSCSDDERQDAALEIARLILASFPNPG